MTMRQFGLTLLLACVILTSAQADEAGRMSVASKGDDTNAKTHVLVSVGKADLTTEGLEALTAFRAAPSLAAMRNSGNPLMDSRSVLGVQTAYRRRVTAEFIKRELLAGYAQMKGLSPDADCQAAAAREVEQFLKTEKKSGYRATLEKLPERLALAESARKALLADFHYVPEASVVSNVMSRMRLYNERIAATNRLVRAHAESVAQKAACSVADFAAIAISNGVVEEASELEWGQMDAETFESEYPKLFAALGKSPIGTVSPPVEEDHAILIGKLTGKTEATEDEPAQFTVSCMRFPFAIEAKESSFEEMSARLVAEKRKVFLDEALERINKTIRTRIVDAANFPR